MDSENEHIKKQLQVIKALREDIEEGRRINPAEAHRNTLRKIRKQTQRERILYLFSRAASIIVIPLLISTSILCWLLFTGDRIRDEKISMVEMSAAPGSIIQAELPDQSRVWINGGSSIRYPSRFKPEKRQVELTGEAYFEVESDPNHPFEVNLAFGADVVATGTAFNVKAYEDDTRQEITLKEGIIDVLFGGRSLQVLPNEMVYIHPGLLTMEKGDINIDEKIGWKDGLLIFRNTPLKEVLKTLSRRYNVEIIMHEKNDTPYHIRATFSTETIDQILNVLKIAAPITWSIKDLEQQEDLTFSRQVIDVWVK